MSEETLLTAARRVVRFFNIDMNGGGLMTVDTQQAVETLDKYVRIESEKDKQMQVTITKAETQALFEMESFLKGAATPTPQFITWIVERLTMKYGDDPNVDFIMKLKEHAELFRKLHYLLQIKGE